MEIKGRIVQVLPVEGGTSRNGNQWSKASLIVEVAENPQYPKKIKISNMKNAETFSKLAIGSEVTFKVEIESREYNNRWYTEVSCWGWDVATPTQPAPAPQGWESVYPTPAPSQTQAAEPEPTDLPF